MSSDQGLTGLRSRCQPRCGSDRELRVLFQVRCGKEWVPCAYRTECPAFSVAVGTGPFSVVEQTRHSLPCGPLHSMAVDFLKASRGTSPSTLLRQSHIMEHNPGSDIPSRSQVLPTLKRRGLCRVCTPGGSSLQGHPRILLATNQVSTVTPLCPG